MDVGTAGFEGGVKRRANPLILKQDSNKCYHKIEPRAVRFTYI